MCVIGFDKKNIESVWQVPDTLDIMDIYLTANRAIFIHLFIYYLKKKKYLADIN